MTAGAMGYEKIKELAREHRLTIPSVLALARCNDPFFVGSPAQLDKAEWFANLWHRFGFANGVHLRRIHYRIVVEADVKRHDGQPYQNTDNDWSLLQDAGKLARHLGLIRPDAFVDNRNPAPSVFFQRVERGGAQFWLDDGHEWRLPEIRADLGGVSFGVPDIHVDGYEYEGGDQPYLLEVWIEKSTMEDVLEPLCRSLNVNLVPSAGYQSITAAVNLLQRVASLGKPARVFYVSDFDPAGDHMPVAVARQIEYWLPEYAPAADVKLTPLALTKQQTIDYKLPRVPIKNEDKRKAGFELLHGEGAVELDALEALHPGSLDRIVRKAVAPYKDPTLRNRLQEAEAEAEDLAREEWRRETADVRQELKDIQAEARVVAGEYEARLRQMGEELRARLAPLAERLDAVRHAMQAAWDAFEVNLPERPEPETAPTDEQAWLFDAGRPYMEQMRHYKSRKGIDR